jgi:hypothetical protein
VSSQLSSKHRISVALTAAFGARVVNETADSPRDGATGPDTVPLFVVAPDGALTGAADGHRLPVRPGDNVIALRGA